MTIGILGGGLTGCVLGKLFFERGWSFEILEAESEVGGLLRSQSIGGYTFDIGGPHILFSKNNQALRFLLDAISGNVSTRRRNTKVLFKRRYVKYPFENGLSDLPLMDNLACLEGFASAAFKRKIHIAAPPRNLREWCVTSFGKGISARYLIPYNEKIWKFPLEDMSIGWVERIPNPPLLDVLKSSLGLDTEGYAHQLNFHYPTNGGIQAVIEGLTEDYHDKIVCDFEVKFVSRTEGKWGVSDGRVTRNYDKIVSTIPLPILAETAQFPDSVMRAAQDLKTNSVICVCLGGVDISRTDLSWLYLPAKTSLAHRVSFLSNSSEMSAPRGMHSFIADITCKFNDDVWKMSDDELVRRTIRDLMSEGVLTSSKADVALVTRQRYAYIIDDLNRKKNLETVNQYLSSIGLLTCGRFAEYEYLNMDGVVLHASNLVNMHEGMLREAG